MAEFLKYGADAKQAMAKEEARDAENYEPFRFWLKAGEEAKITFLDGELHEDGMLAIPMFYEHRVNHSGRWTTFICTAAQEPCPLCATENNRPALVGAMTVIDHRKIEGKNRVYHMEKKLFICKKRTIQLLTKQAEKREGLTGCTFEVERSSGDRSIAVGDNFDFCKKNPLSKIAETLGDEKGTPYSYSDALVYRDAKTLIGMGVGVETVAVGSDSNTTTAPEEGKSDQAVADFL